MTRKSFVITEVSSSPLLIIGNLQDGYSTNRSPETYQVVSKAHRWSSKMDFQAMKYSIFIKASGRYLLVGLLGFSSVTGATVQETAYETALESAVAWLVNRQNSDGSWSGDRETRTLHTSESTLALSATGRRDTSFYRGITWLSNHATTNVDFRARRIAALDRHGDSLADEFSRLHSARQGGDSGNRGWGLTAGYRESVLDTALSLLAYSVAPDIGGNANIQAALDYLAMQTLPDDPVVVSYLLRAITPYQATHTVSMGLVDSASIYLRDRIDNTDTALTQALSALALSRAGTHPDKVTALLNGLLLLQTTTGEEQGSWEKDEYVTAVAIRAFSASLGTDASELSEKVYIPDPVLRRYINAALGRNSADSLAGSELLRLTRLIAPNAGITDLTGLEMASGIETIDLSGNAISDLSPLSGLEKLTTAMDDIADTDEDLAVSIAVLSNDIHPNGTNPTVAGVSQPTNGAASFTNSSVIYTPSSDYHGTDTFTYTAAHGDTAVTALVTVTVNPVNDAPTAVMDSVDIFDHTPIAIDVLANDNDVDGDPLSTQGIITAPAFGTAVIEAGGQITYTPNPGFAGIDTFHYTVGDGMSTAQATVTVTVTPTPYAYYILNPRFDDGPAFVVSLSDNNIIHAGDTESTLNRHQRGTIPMADLVQGTKVTGTAPFELAGSVDATDAPLSDLLAGQEFVIPHVHGNHWVYLLSPDGEASVTIDTGDATTTHALPAGQVVTVNTGTNNTVSSVITSDAPILVAHVGTDSAGLPMGASMVPPAATELWGILGSQTAWLGASEDLTTVNIYADNGTSVTGIVLDAGDRHAIGNVGIPGNQGTGSALRISADKPIGAVQDDDGDGNDRTAFLPTEYLAMHFGLPVDAQYLAVVCPWPNTVITLQDGGNPPQQKTCSGSGYPGKVYFGSSNNGNHLAAGATIQSSEPVYLIYEDSAHDDERNLMGTGE
uniref:Prenyltransferase-like n=1 Tax=Candidatus Kentrum sp. LFY TaxID=2126342 RepID=A0A450UYE0_9GAMM|nr:MAG: Prenyltransferase-like [Candidatus Kentron sp. LFY]